jgi:predicted metal-binding membrane protein
MSAAGFVAFSLPRRDRVAIWCGLVGVSAVAWAYLVHMAMGMDGMTGMSDMDMAGMEMAGMDHGGMLMIHRWAAADFVLMFLMWAVMMVGMMVPTAIPMTLIYAAVARKAEAQRTPIAPAFVFVGGYVAIWTIVSVGATLAQWGLDQAALLSPMLVTTRPALGAGLLIAAGIYQLTPAKNACLEHCRMPAHFISKHWRKGTAGAFRMGLEHGAFCLGCCWALMLLLFFGGVMNLLWIAGITLFVLLEKVIPHGVGGGKLAGGAMIVAGVVMLVLAG